MLIGVVSENRPEEKRIALLPEQLKGLAVHHDILVEKNAGSGIDIDDNAYTSAGAKIVSREIAYAADIVIRINAPDETELKLMRQGSTVMCMLHLKVRAELVNNLKKYGINAIALEELKNAFGERMVEALHLTGCLGMTKGFELWGKDPGTAVVKIMGYGNVAMGAIETAARKFAHVIILNKKDIYEMEKHLPDTDLLVNALNWPYELRGKVFLVRREMLTLLNKNAVIVDLVSNPAGQSPVETCHPTNLANISYNVDGIVHTACWGWPGLDPENCSRRYSIQIEPILSEIAMRDFKDLPAYIKKAYFSA